MKINNYIPAYRFQGYTDAWELRKLGEFVDKAVDNRGKTPSLDEEGTHPLIEVAALGGVHPDYTKIDKYLNDESFENNLRSYVKKDDILFTTVGSIGLVSLMDSREEAAIAQNIVAFRAKDNFVPSYLYSLFTNKENQKKAIRIVMGAVQPSIKVSQLVGVEYMLTQNRVEQEAIGTFFSTLDQHITLHQRKLDTLKEQKKTYLKLLFPAKGQTKPALRFQGFEDDWEEVKLGELCDIRTGKLDANAMVENGKYDFYTSGIKKYKIDVAEFEGPAITIAGNGATVGYMHLADGKFNAYQRTYVLTNFKVDRSYIFSEVAEKLPMKIQQEARTGNIPYIVLSMLTELSISLPSLPEQEAIGTFFQTLDQEIAQVEDKLASLKEMKKTLLRKLFV
ncbi:TPA: restriction endonuclease subunit S [Streptococcus suis]